MTIPISKKNNPTTQKATVMSVVKRFLYSSGFVAGFTAFGGLCTRTGVLDENRLNSVLRIDSFAVEPVPKSAVVED